MHDTDLRLDPAYSIVCTFGGGKFSRGVQEVSRITGRDHSRIRRWMYPKDKGGTGGLVPSSAAPILFAEAQKRELPIEAADFFRVSPGVRRARERSAA